MKQMGSRLTVLMMFCCAMACDAFQLESSRVAISSASQSNSKSNDAVPVVGRWFSKQALPIGGKHSFERIQDIDRHVELTVSSNRTFAWKYGSKSVGTWRLRKDGYEFRFKTERGRGSPTARGVLSKDGNSLTLTASKSNPLWTGPSTISFQRAPVD